jgi:hypothetical protein
MTSSAIRPRPSRTPTVGRCASSARAVRDRCRRARCTVSAPSARRQATPRATGSADQRRACQVRPPSVRVGRAPCGREAALASWWPWTSRRCSPRLTSRSAVIPSTTRRTRLSSVTAGWSGVLARRRAGQAETLLVGRIADLALDAALPPGVVLRPVVGERDIAALLAVSDEVFGGHHGPAGSALAAALGAGDDHALHLYRLSPRGRQGAR